MSGAEAIAVIGLIDACIGITKQIVEFAQAVKDDQGLPKRLYDLFEKLPVIEELLDNAHDNCEDGTATEDSKESARPILEQCQKALGELREILRKACPKDSDNRSKRIWKGAKTIFLGRNSQIQELLNTILDNLKLLEQKKIYAIGDKLDDLQELTEALSREDDGKYSHSGTGNIIANEGGNNTNYVQGGSHNRQIINPGIYHEGPIPVNNSYFSERPETPPEPTSNVPFPRDPCYVERALLSEQIHALLKQPGGRVALVGLGGVGKSQLAIEYARAVRKASPQTWVLWIHASSTARFDQSVHQVADLLKLSGRKEPKADILQLLHSWLCNVRKGRWLIVLDNADNADFLVEQSAVTADGTSATKRLLDYIPASDHGSVLFTTRSKSEARKLVHESNIIDVRPMSEQEAEALLTRKLDGSSPDDRRLVQALECIPLAITQAAAFIRERGLRCTVHQYCDELERSRASRTRLLQRNVQIPNRDQEAINAVMLTWQISFEHLNATRQDAAELLSLMSFCDRLAIPEILINADMNNSDDSIFSLAFDENIAALCSFSFVSQTTDPRIWEMHRLVQDATQVWLKEHRYFDNFLSKFVQCIAAAFPPAHYENWPRCAVLFPHAVSISECKPLDRNALLEWAAVMFKTAWYASKQGQYEVAVSIGRLSMQVQSEMLGNESEDTLWSTAVVAEALRNQGRLKEAEELDMAVMEIRKAMLRPEHLDTLTSMGNLALTYRHQGRFKEAEVLQVAVTETHKAVLGPQHPDTLTSMGNLALTYRHQGRFKEAEELEVAVTETHKAVLGPQHPNTLTSMGNLALTYQNQGRFQEAEELQVAVVEMFKGALGPQHPHTLTSMDNLALTYRHQGRFQEAEELELAVMETSKAVLGPQHPDTLTSMGNLATTYWHQGRFQEAEELEVAVMETSKAMLGPQHPHTLTSMGNLALTCRHQGRFQEAEELEVVVTETHKAVLGPQHPDTLTSMGNLALTYRHQGRFKEAEELEVAVMETRKAVLGPQHPYTLTSMGNLATIYWHQGRFKEAEELEVAVMETRKAVLGPQHPDTLTSMKNLALTYRSQGRRETAGAIEEEIKAIGHAVTPAPASS